MNAIISIGRGRPQDANYLANGEWSFFRRSLDIVAENHGEAVSRTSGQSWSRGWGGEESYTIVIEVQPSSFPTLISLSSDLADLAARYHQDAIALTVGLTHLVGRA